MRTGSSQVEKICCQVGMMEPLEQRRLLAGNVSLALNGAGNLLINGDGRSNQIEIVANAGGFSIIGAGTSINSAAAGAVPIANGFFIPGTARDLIVNLANGDDRVTLSGTAADSDITIRTGNGDDDISVGPGAFSDGALTIETGKGKDRVRLGAAELLHIDLDVDLGKGSDTFELTGPVFVVLSTATLDAGQGRDTIVNETLFASASSTIDLLGFENHLP